MSRYLGEIEKVEILDSKVVISLRRRRRGKALEAIEKYQRRFKKFSGDIKNRAKLLSLVSETYDDNSKRMEESEKGSREHTRLLLIEDCLNSRGQEIRSVIFGKTPYNKKGATPCHKKNKI